MSLKKSRFIKGIVLAPDSIALDGIEGEIKVDSSTGKIQVTLKDGVNPSASREIVTSSQTQTLTNKIIDASLNTISNISTTMLASGVLDTDLTSVSTSDDTLPSAKAVKTYVDTQVGGKDEASEIIVSPAIGGFTANVQATLQGHQDLIDDLVTLSGVSANAENLGSFTGTTIPDNSTIKSAIQSLETEVETKAESSDLTTHTGASSSVHGVTGSVVGTSDSQALTNKTIDADLNTISNIENADIKVGAAIARAKLASGTANRVVVNDATGVQTDAAAITASRALISDANGIPTHSSTTSTEIGHLSGVTSAIQTQLDGKVDESGGTLTSGSVITPARLDVKQDTYSNLLTYATSASNGQLCFATDTKSMYQVVDNNLVSVGAGSGTSDTVFLLDGTELITNWSTGNNASFLGGGTISGTFAKETVSPLNGLSSYKYTQAAGSLNDYIASPIKTVANRFKGQNCIISFPFNYDGNNSDVELVIYDVTNTAVIPTSFFLDGSSTTKVFTGYITIPATCSSIRIGFKVAVANSGKILNFDDIQLSQTSLYVPQPESQSSFITPSGNFNGDFTGTLTSTSSSGIYSYNSSTGVYTVLKKASFNLNFAIRNTAAALVGCRIYVDSSQVASDYTPVNAGAEASCSYSIILNSGQTFKFQTDGTVSTINTRASVLATALSDQILTAPETFSTDTAPLTYAGSGTYTLSTLANAPVGTFITFTYAANTSTRTQTLSTPPNQLPADMNANGILLYTRAYNAPSSAGQPAAIAIQIGKGLKGKSLDLYKTAGKATAGSIDYYNLGSSGTFAEGIRIKEYNELTGVLVIDAGQQPLTITGGATFNYSDLTSQTSGYLVINASKNPALTGLGLNQVAARGVNTAGTSIPGTGTPTVVTFDSNKTFDTTGSLNTSTGVFTSPEIGYYQVNAMVSYSNITTQNIINATIIKNGTSLAQNTIVTQNTATTYAVSVSDVVFLNKGDTLSMGASQNTGSGKSLSTGNGLNFFSIVKVSV